MGRIITAVKQYFTMINLSDYDLSGCEITEEDYENIAKKIATGNKTMQAVVDEYLYSIRNILDAGLIEA